MSSFLLKATFLDPRYKSLHNIAKEGAVFVTKQAIRDMCIKVAESKSVRESTEANTSAPDMLCLPSLPASAAVKEEPPAEITASSSQDYEPPKKKVKIEAEYDDWLSDVIYIGTETGAKSSNQELISPSFANSSCTLKSLITLYINTCKSHFSFHSMCIYV